MSDEIGFRSEQDQTVVSIFLGTGPDEGFVGLILRDAPLIELNGQLQPGIRMTPAQAVSLARELVDKAVIQMRCEALDEEGRRCLLNSGHQGTGHCFVLPEGSTS